jgi:peptide/nickel transport system substrate-binding protein
MANNPTRTDLNPLARLEATRRGVLLGAGGLGLGAMLAACTSSGDAPQTKGSATATGPAKNQTLTIGIEGIGDQTPDPHLCRGSGGGYVVLWGLGENLARRDLDSRIVPNLATKWDVSKDGLSWRFTLREGVKMHDGSAFTADDVKTAVDRIAADDFTPGFAGFKRSKPVARVLDATHVEIRTSEPLATLLDDMPVPIPTKYYRQVGEHGFRKNPKAAGAFRFAGQSLNSSMTFERFDDFFDASRLANFKTLKLQIIADEATRVAAMQSGSLDAVHGLSPVSIQQLKQANNVRLITVNSVGFAFLYFNDLNYPDRKTPFNDIRVRQALSYAIDRDAIAKSVFKDLATPTGNYWFKATPGYDSSLKPTPYDPAKAKSLLREAGYSSIQLNLGSKVADAVIPDIQQLALAIQSYWHDIGINVKYTPVDPAITTSNNSAKNWPSGAQIASFPGNLLLDPGTPSNIVFDSAGGAPRVNDPNLDTLVRRLSATLDASERGDAGQAVADDVAKHSYALPLVELNGAIAIGPKVRSWKQQTSSPYAGPWWYLRAN